MSGFENVIGGKLKLKGKALDVKGGGVKKKKKQKKHEDQIVKISESDLSGGGSAELTSDHNEEEYAEKSSEERKSAPRDDTLTPAERRYIEQKEKINRHRLAKEANKSHRDRIQDFNQYLANMSEHYDIPKVGPG